ncbi:MAG: 3-deoxy-manno-octulosonate cytidylyltransferase [Simkaniaceae bacterium]|nr:3-deoxy-manno-octulosonate cytidylyltransferase [Simkaniaceae bacterium]MCF7852403.1 3-deoxy-manno-octulosonate cytidylyltransferase [Simkaniaceae bacterium]
MIGKSRVVCIIPARLNSSRFPEKVLKLIQGKPMLQWVWESANHCPQFDDVCFAVDHEKTARLIDSFGGTWQISGSHHANGTRRLIEVMQKKEIKGDIWVNWQADEPFIHADIIQDLLPSDHNDQSDIWTLKKRIDSADELTDSSVVKVVTRSDGKALYFSRHSIPFNRSNRPISLYKHIGLYAYSQRALEVIATLPSSDLEEIEGLEQLGFLYHGLSIQVFETAFETLGIDLPSDLDKANALSSIL